MHIPLGKMNTFLLTCLYLSFTYVHASLMCPFPLFPFTLTWTHRLFHSNLSVPASAPTVSSTRLYIYSTWQLRADNFRSLKVRFMPICVYKVGTNTWQCIFEKGYTSELQTNAIEPTSSCWSSKYFSCQRQTSFFVHNSTPRRTEKNKQTNN